MNNKVTWLLVLLIILAAFQLPQWASAQDGQRDTQADELAPYKDWLWGVLSQGIRVTGGSECAETDAGTRCAFDFTVQWAE